MILSALCKYYDRLVENGHSAIPLPGHTYLRITHVFEISKQGKLVHVMPLGDNGQRSLVPWTLEAACRKSNLAAYLLADKAKYSLGFAGDTLTPEAGLTFRKIVSDLAARTQDEGILAVHRFLQGWNPRAALTWDEKEAVALGTIAFKLQGDSCLVHERPAFRKYWEHNWLTWGGDTLKVKAKCLVTGREQYIARIHQPLKEVKDSQTTGAALVSFNKDAFSSYGKEQSYNAPVGEEAAFAYTTALNHLLHKENGHSIQIGDATTVFWTDSPETKAAIRTLIAPEDAENALGEEEWLYTRNGKNAQTVREMLTALRNEESRHPSCGDSALLETQCYILGLQANKARLAVRFWHSGSLGELVHAVGQHYSDIAMERQHDSQPVLPSIRQLLCAAGSIQFRNNAHFKDFDTAPPILSGALVRSILTGIPYPQSLFSIVLSRIRADKQVTYLRAATLKACLLRNHPETAKDLPITIDDARKDAPYLLGRLFAILEKTQLDARGFEDGGAFRDRCFNTASTTPSRVFPELLRLSRQHVKKTEFGNAHAKKIRDVSQAIDNFPSHLTLPEQGIFSIGYYHQKNVYHSARKQEIPHGYH
jgi:CRISPR-associated protein Csd1